MYNINCLCWVKENHFLLRNSWKIRVGCTNTDTRVQLSPMGGHSHATAHYLASLKASIWDSGIFSSHSMSVDISQHKLYNDEKLNYSNYCPDQNHVLHNKLLFLCNNS